LRWGENTTKYWKGKIGTVKEGQFGTMDDAGSVPDSNLSTKIEYDAWIAAQPVIPDTAKAEYSALSTDAERIHYIAKKLGLLP